MHTILSLTLLSLFLISGSPVRLLQTHPVPTREEARRLQHSRDSYEVYVDAQGVVAYREYKDNKVRGEKLPFDITLKKSDAAVPYATTITPAHDFVIATSKGLLKVRKDGTTQTLVRKGCWSEGLYPNSILLDGQTLYIGMRGGIVTMDIDYPERQQWLAKE